MKEIWNNVSEKINQRKYNCEDKNEFLSDIQPLFEILKDHQKNCVVGVGIGIGVVEEIGIEIFSDLLDITKPLNEIQGLKYQKNGSQQLTNNLREETTPTVILRLFQFGQGAGSAASKSAILPKSITSSKSKSSSSTSHSFSSSSSSLKPTITNIPNIFFTREIQPPPFQYCLPHEKFYGVWENPTTKRFIAQVCFILIIYFYYNFIYFIFIVL